MQSSRIPESIGRYKIERELGKGQGGMGRVFRAQLPGRPSVVLKVGLERRNSALVNEAAILRHLNHRNIVRILGTKQQDKVAYVQKEYVDGEACLLVALELVDGRTVNTVGRMKPGHVARVIREVAAALDYAHQRGVAHLDVKPANVMVSADLRRVVLIDWGTAELVGNAKNQERQGRFYTPEYVAPERVEGSPTDIRNDVYSLGVTAFELLTGTVPFKKTTGKETARAHISDPLPEEPLKRLPPPVQAVLRRALAKRPSDRYSSAGALAHDLARALPSEAPVWRLAASVGAGVVAIACIIGLAIAGLTAVKTADLPVTPPQSQASGGNAGTPIPSVTPGATVGPSSTLVPTAVLPSPTATPRISPTSTPTVRPIVSATPTPPVIISPTTAPATAVPVSAPRLLEPDNNASRSSPNEVIMLRWSVPPDFQGSADYFLVHIRVVDSQQLDVNHFTKDNSYQVPAHLFATSNRLEWYVVPWRSTGSDPRDGAPAGPESETRTFIWK